MPFQITPKPRLSATAPACRAIVAARLTAPELEEAALRALQFAQFTTARVLEEPETLRGALAGVDGLDADSVVERIADPEVRWPTRPTAPMRALRSARRRSSRAARRTPTASCATPRRRSSSAPRTGGPWRPAGSSRSRAYDVVVANLDPALDRRPPAEDPLEVLAAFPYPLTTAEVAAVMTPHLALADTAGVEAALIAAAGEGRVTRQPAGDGSLWSPTQVIRRRSRHPA